MFDSVNPQQPRPHTRCTACAARNPSNYNNNPPFDFNGMLALVDAADLHEHDPRRKTFETGRFEKSFYVELRASSSAGT